MNERNRYVTLPVDGSDSVGASRFAVHETVPQSLHPRRVGGRPTSLVAPTRLGRYRIVRLLGTGSMGMVYDAIADDDGGHVALKIIRDQDSERTLRLKREFRSLARISHPGLVTLYDLGEDEGAVFFTMELLDGVDIAEFVSGPVLADGSRAPAVDGAEVAGVMRDAARALQAVHAAGLVHRDVKPSNVMVTREGRVVLLDLGLVRDLADDAGPGDAASRKVAGTPLYMSPEQLRRPQGVGPASDWYAFGELLYELLTGSPRLRHCDFHELVTRKLGEPEPPVLTGDAVLDSLALLAFDLLRRDPFERPLGPDVISRLGGTLDDVFVPARVPPFFGRSDELVVLQSSLDACGSGHAVVCLVEGMSGVGKTALIERFCAETRTRPNAQVFFGRSSERESIPYKAVDRVVEALATRLSREPELGQALDPRQADAVGRLFPALQLALQRRPDLSDAHTPDPVEERRLGFLAVAALLGQLCRRGPVVICLDDVQWADVDSICLVEALLRPPAALPLLVIGACRAGATGEGLVLFREVLKTLPDVTVRHVSLGPLDSVAARSLAEATIRDVGHDAALAGERGQSDLFSLGNVERRLASVERVVRESAGSPFFLLELARYAARAPDFACVALDVVIDARLSRLGSSERRLLWMVAMAGGRLDRRVAVRSLGHGLDARKAVVRLVAESLLRTSGVGASAVLETYHDRIREAAVRAVPSELRAGLHLTIANELVRLGQVDPVDLAFHFRAGGDEVEADVHTLAAATAAEEALAFEQAARFIAILLESPRLAARDRASLTARRAAALANAGDVGESGRQYLAAAASAGVGVEEQAEWRRLAAEHLLSSGYTEEGRAVLAELMTSHGLALPTSMASAVAGLLFHRGRLRMSGLRVRLRPERDWSGHVQLQADACWTASRGLLFTDGLSGAYFHARHVRFALELGEPVRIARALAAEAQFRAGMDGTPSLVACEPIFAEAERIATQAGSPYALAMIDSARGSAFICAGRFRASIEAYQRAIDRFRTECTGVSHEIAICEAPMSSSMLFVGRIRELRALAFRMVHESLERPNPYVEGFGRGHLGNMALLALGDVVGATEHLRQYRRDAPKRFQTHWINCAAQTAAIERYQDRPLAGFRAMEAEYRAVIRLDVCRAPMPRCEALFWRGESVVALAAAVMQGRAGSDGAPIPSAAALRKMVMEVIVELERLPYDVASAYAGLLRSSVHVTDGHPDKAIAQLRRAIAAFDAFEMGAFLAASQRRLSALVGGDEGRDARAQSDGWMTREGVVDSESLTRMMAPGFVAL